MLKVCWRCNCLWLWYVIKMKIENDCLNSNTSTIADTQSANVKRAWKNECGLMSTNNIRRHNLKSTKNDVQSKRTHTCLLTMTNAYIIGTRICTQYNVHRTTECLGFKCGFLDCEKTDNEETFVKQLYTAEVLI